MGRTHRSWRPGRLLCVPHACSAGKCVWRELDGSSVRILLSQQTEQSSIIEVGLSSQRQEMAKNLESISRMTSISGRAADGIASTSKILPVFDMHQTSTPARAENPSRCVRHVVALPVCSMLHSIPAETFQPQAGAPNG